MTVPNAAIDAYLEGQLTDELARDIDRWIAADPASAKAFLHLVRTHQTLGIIGKENQLSRQADLATPDQLDAVTLASLARMEAEAQSLPFEALDQPFSFDQPTQSESSPQDPSLSQALDDLRWAAGKFAGRLIRSPYGITTAVAAMLLVCLLILAPWQTPNNTTTHTNPTASADPTPQTPNPTTPPTVATITAQRDAAWATLAGVGSPAPDLTPGTALAPGQRLTLTQGFAEITTARGAIAILEAPTTIELLNSDNALRLHTGKLVGICETESSKGFIVRTPHMDVIDLGTRFGVDATQPRAAEVHVFEGEVQATQQTGHGSPDIIEYLTEGDTIRVNSSERGFKFVKRDVTSFDALTTYARSIVNGEASEAGIAAMSGDIRWSPRTAYLDINQWRSDDRAVVFEELSSYELGVDTAVTLLGPDSTTDANGSSPALSIPAGTKVRTYVVLLYSETPGHMSRPQGSVTFAGEVIGVATSAQQASDFTDQVGGLAQLAPVNNAEYHWLDKDDTASLQDDGHTVSFAFSAGQRTTDAIRVFVRVPKD